jgi:DNA (cytosine-5)-methyltransferase 1
MNPMNNSANVKQAPKALTAIELFCGIGGFRLASDSLGIRTVWANDINASSCAVYRHRFGSGELVEGDVTSMIDQVPEHDVLTGGFPCQPFSAAGKKLGIKDPRGTLFQSIVDILERQQPEYFVLENVKRMLTMEQGIHFATVLAALSRLSYFVEWRVLNAKHFGLAQNRERVVIVGRKVGVDPDPESLVRLLPEADAHELPSRVIAALSCPREWRPVEQHSVKFPSWGVALDGKFLACDADVFTVAKPIVKLDQVLSPSVASEYDLTESTLARLGMNEAVDRFVNGVEIVSNQGGGARMGYTIFGTRGLAPTLTASTSRHYERYYVGGRYRRLTPEEYARLQGFPDNHCDSQRPYEQYTLYGNAVPPALVRWAMHRLTSSGEAVRQAFTSREPDLFDAQ